MAPLSPASFAETAGGQGVGENKVFFLFVYLFVLIVVIPPLLKNNSETTLRPTKHNQLGKRPAWDSEYFIIFLRTNTQRIKELRIYRPSVTNQ